MPKLIDYPTVLATMTGMGLKSLYYNSGAFGFPDVKAVRYGGWVLGEDSTLRPEMVNVARVVEPPTVETLARIAWGVWETELAGVAWVMPLSHWAYEMDFGSREWLPGVIEQLGLDGRTVAGLHTGDAVEFGPDEGERFQFFLGELLANLRMSDFMIAFPGRRALCTVHHHRQLWWASDDGALLARVMAY